MRFFVIISIFFFTSNIILSQENKKAPKWINIEKANSIYKKDNFFLLDSIRLRKSKIKKFKEEKIHVYKKRLAANIHTRIDQKIQKSSYEKTTNQSSSFDETMEVEVLMDSEVDLINCFVKYYFDKKKKIFFFIIIQNKKILE